MSSIPMSSNKTAWKGSLEWSYSGGYVTVTMQTWKTDGYPSSATSGANFTASITIGSSSKTFTFQQQEVSTMTVGTLRVYVSDNVVTISGRVEAPSGVSMYGNPLTGSETVTLYTEEEKDPISPSDLSLGAQEIAMGDTLNISITRYDALCRHKLSYQLYANGGAKTLLASDVLTQYAWRVPDLTGQFSDGLEVSVRIFCATYDGDAVYVGETYQDLRVTVPAATIPSCASTAAMGSTLSISLERKAGGFTHDLSYTLGDAAGDIVKGAQAACSWEIPLDLAKTIPLLTKGTCTITCVTYHGSAEVGRSKATVSLTVPDNDMTKPTVSMVLSPSGNLGAQFTGMYIRGRTGVRAEFTGSSEYSEVKSYQLVVDGVAVTGNPAESAYLNSYGEVTVTGRAVDARGYAREITQVIPVIPYDKPRVIPYTGESTLVATRCNLDGTRNVRGQHLLIRAGRKYTALTTADGQLNDCELRYRIKKASAEDYADYYTLLPGDDRSSDYVETVVANAVPELKTGYTVQIEAADTLGCYSVITVPVAALTIPFHIGESSGNVAVGKYCDYSRRDAFEIGFTTYFDTGIALREVFSEGSWEVGAELGSSVPDAEDSALQCYSFFLGVCAGEPIWLMKLGPGIFGSGVRVTYDNGTAVLNTAPTAMTALYAVL